MTAKHSRHDYITISVLLQGAPYQRPLDTDRVKEYSENFDVSMLQIIDVAENDDGTYEIIDGQHRVEAMKILGWTEPILCHVSYGLTPQERAERFVRLSTEQKKLTEIDLFWAHVEAGAPIQTNILRIVRETGYDVIRPGTPGGSRRGVLWCIGALTKAYSIRDELTLSLTLQAMHDAGWNGADIKTTHVRAISSFVVRYRGEYRAKRLVEILESTTPIRVGAGVKATESEFALAGNKSGAHSGGTFILRSYNKGLRTQRLDEWDVRSTVGQPRPRLKERDE